MRSTARYSPDALDRDDDDALAPPVTMCVALHEWGATPERVEGWRRAGIEVSALAEGSSGDGVSAADSWPRGYPIARVIDDRRTQYVVHDGVRDMLAEASPELLRAARRGREQRPVVGDFVRLERMGAPDVRSSAAGDGVGTGRPAVVLGVLPRSNWFSRKKARLELREQIVAANVDEVLVVTAMVGDFNPRRLERYLALVLESNAVPVFVLTKRDQCSDPNAVLEACREVVGGATVIAVDLRAERDEVHDETGVGEVRARLVQGKTIALLGSSGVGKSTLLNRLVGEEIARAGETRRDGKGRHTTTRRQIIRVPPRFRGDATWSTPGGLLVDTPGMRELGLWEVDSGLREAFADIETMAAACRFRDCSHAHEPGCVVRSAIQDGTLDAERAAHHRRLKGELAELESDVQLGRRRQRR